MPDHLPTWLIAGMSPEPLEHRFRVALSSTTRAKVRGVRDAAQRARDEVNELLLRNWPVGDGKFELITLVIRHVAPEDDDVDVEPVVRRRKKDGELPVVVDVPVKPLQALTVGEVELVHKRLMLRSLVAALKSEGVDAGFAEVALRELG